jgi:type VI secretion system protein VasD
VDLKEGRYVTRILQVNNFRRQLQRANRGITMAICASFHKTHYAFVLPFIALIVSSGCAKPPPPVVPPPKPTVLDISMLVEPAANADARGRASPVVLRFYELKSLTAFQAADFFSLFDRDKDTLGSELVVREEMVLQPGERREYQRELHADTRFIAVTAAYRDIERSSWRGSMPVTLHATVPVRIDVQERRVSIEKK